MIQAHSEYSVNAAGSGSSSSPKSGYMLMYGEGKVM